MNANTELENEASSVLLWRTWKITKLVLNYEIRGVSYDFVEVYETFLGISFSRGRVDVQVNNHFCICRLWSIFKSRIMYFFDCSRALWLSVEANISWHVIYFEVLVSYKNKVQEWVLNTSALQIWVLNINANLFTKNFIARWLLVDIF